ncbi:hypothetical protein BC829DRAFT_248812 [Chytridium lagenaria]|nr:hypothetical protein BC829DRAFT_248812 [Chytridium lagenaria]
MEVSIACFFVCSFCFLSFLSVFVFSRLLILFPHCFFFFFIYGHSVIIFFFSNLFLSFSFFRFPCFCRVLCRLFSVACFFVFFFGIFLCGSGFSVVSCFSFFSFSFPFLSFFFLRVRLMILWYTIASSFLLFF